MPRNYYKILGISHSADLEEIKQATQTKANEIKTVLSFAFLPHAEAQARLNEIEEAFETLSKPETRAAYDSQWQPAKSPLPHSPPIPLQAKMDDVVIKQKSVPLPDRDESQVSPYRPPTTLLTNADRNIEGVELAERDTRLLAAIGGVVVVGAPFIFLWLFYSFIAFWMKEDPAALFFAKVIGWCFIGSVLTTNLVLLYRQGQTLSKRLLSIKIVNADGSRAEVGTLLVRALVTPGISIPLLIAILILIKDLAFPAPLIAIIGRPSHIILPLIVLLITIIGPLITLLDSLPIFQNSRLCLHDMIANTIVVKVFPGENDTSYGSLSGAIGISLLCVVPLLLILYYTALRILQFLDK
jgi:uncharacterized RDD family membrane protein YckC